MKKTKKVLKSAITGRFTSKRNVKRNPNTTFAETVGTKKKK